MAEDKYARKGGQSRRGKNRTERPIVRAKKRPPRPPRALTPPPASGPGSDEDPILRGPPSLDEINRGTT